MEHPTELQLSLDGVQECRSNSVSLDVYSVKMTNCRNIYPLRIIRPIDRYKIEYKAHLKSILDSCHGPNCFLRNFIADNPKRAIIREALQHSSNYACEYCESKAMQYIERNLKLSEEKKKNDLQIKQFEKQITSLNNAPCSTSNLPQKEQQIRVMRELIRELKKRNASLNKKQNHSVWPESTRNGQLRTRENILSIVEAIEEDISQLTADDVKGIVGRSLLLDLDEFDFVLAIPAEYMHVACLGVVKREKNHTLYNI